ncbi:FG-GAP-like repeat-containing protein [Streptomyces sp. NPDC051976]|uniref:FG-GAP-like repeat-containing protein n=1 Tax=Streptomyces sp. NPDC051976 TaxID=3154947 RepID=UPI00343D82C6
MRFSVRAFFTAAAVTAGLLTAAGTAHAATGYDRCAWGRACVFDGPRGTGAMTVITGDRATLGSWDNRITSLANFTDLAMCLYAAPDYQGGESPEDIEYSGEISYDESPMPQLDNAISSVEFTTDGYDCGSNRDFPFWGNDIRKRPANLPANGHFGDLNGDGIADEISRSQDGLLCFLPGNGGGVRIGGGWNVMTKLVRHGDYNGDGKEDVFARDRDGVLWLYPGNGKGWFAPRVEVGGGWNSMRMLVATGDLNGDGKGDLVAADTSGVLWLYPGNGKGWFGARLRIGGGWNSMTALVGSGDLNHNGKNDLVARDSAGRLWLYLGNGRGWFATRVKIGTGGWNSMQEIYGIGDATGDGLPDIVAHSKDNEVYVYPGTSTGPLRAPSQQGMARDRQFGF